MPHCNIAAAPLLASKTRKLGRTLGQGLPLWGVTVALIDTIAAGERLPRPLGRLVLLKHLARGGMGQVYLASTTGLEGAESAVVVKTIRGDKAKDPSFVARFLDEARVHAQLRHPNVASIVETGREIDGTPYTVVEYVEGKSLADVRHRAMQMGHNMSWGDAVAMGIEIAQGLCHVHERRGSDGRPLQIVHRDLSPQNVVIGYDGEVKLIDFGTARADNRKCRTVSGIVYAKPGYVAPEVGRSEVGDHRIDLYALGVIVWELAKNARYFSGDPGEHMAIVASGRHRYQPIAAAIGAPAELDDVLSKLLNADPEARYQSARAALGDLVRIMSRAPVHPEGRSLRARIASTMRLLYPAEPGQSREEFSNLVDGARAAGLTDPSQQSTPEAPSSSRMRAAGVLGPLPYRLIRTIGEGSAGVVYEAEHQGLGRRVALKLAKEGSSPDHIRAEARAGARLNHAGVVRTLDAGTTEDGRAYIATELLEGCTYRAYAKGLRTGEALPWKLAAAHAREVASALAHVHAHGLVHRDVKPENLFMTSEGSLKILDFGVHAHVGERADGGLAFFGTPTYMAPEQITGEPVDGRTDLYALGCVLYEAICGAPPFAEASSATVMRQQIKQVPPSLRAKTRQALPDALVALVDEMLAKEPNRRPADAAEVVRRIDLLLKPKAPALKHPRVQQAGAAALLLLSGWLVGRLHTPPESPMAAAPVKPAEVSPPTQVPSLAQVPAPAAAPMPAWAPQEPPARQRAAPSRQQPRVEKVRARRVERE